MDKVTTNKVVFGLHNSCETSLLSKLIFPGLQIQTLVLLSQELTKIVMLTLKQKIIRSIFQTFWKTDSCPDFLFCVVLKSILQGFRTWFLNLPILRQHNTCSLLKSTHFKVRHSESECKHKIKASICTVWKNALVIIVLREFVVNWDLF